MKKDKSADILLLHIDGRSFDITSPLTPDIQNMINSFIPSLDLIAAVTRQKV